MPLADYFEIREPQDLSDYHKLNEVMWIVAHNPYNTIFPVRHLITGYTEQEYQESKNADAVRIWEKAKADPASRWIMAVERNTGRIVGGTQWLIYSTNPFPNGPVTVPCTWYPADSEAAEYCSRLATSLARPRAMWCQRPHAGLNATGVLPEYRRRGIGMLLMEWGLKRVDELGYDCFIEGSDLGRALYEKCGFRTVMVHLLDMSKKNPSPIWTRLMHEWGPRPISLLWRPPKGEWTDSTPLGPWDFGRSMAGFQEAGNGIFAWVSAPYFRPLVLNIAASEN